MAFDNIIRMVGKPGADESAVCAINRHLLVRQVEPGAREGRHYILSR